MPRAWIAASGSSGWSAWRSEHGSLDYACAFADGLAGAALAELAAAMAGLPESLDKAFLRSLVFHLRDPGHPRSLTRRPPAPLRESQRRGR